MPEIRARGAASLSAVGNPNDGSTTKQHMNMSTSAGWFMIWWWLSVAIIIFFLWAL